MNMEKALKLRDSLRKRGFWVNIMDNELVLDSWYSESNFVELVRVLTDLQIFSGLGGNGIRIVSDSITEDVLQQIETASKEYLYKNNVSTSTPVLWEFNERKSVTILELDYGIALLVFALNKVGLQTSMSCDGHGRKAPNMWFNYPEYIEKINDILFVVSKEHSFSYDWEIRNESFGFALTAKKRLVKEKWDVGKVHEDVVALSNLILKSKGILID